MRDGGEIGSDLEREERESTRVERLIDRIGWKIQASRDALAPSVIIGYRHIYKGAPGWRVLERLDGLWL